MLNKTTLTHIEVILFDDIDFFSILSNVIIIIFRCDW